MACPSPGCATVVPAAHLRERVLQATVYSLGVGAVLGGAGAAAYLLSGASGGPDCGASDCSSVRSSVSDGDSMDGRSVDGRSSRSSSICSGLIASRRGSDGGLSICLGGDGPGLEGAGGALGVRSRHSSSRLLSQVSVDGGEGLAPALGPGVAGNPAGLVLVAASRHLMIVGYRVRWVLL
jgi:hypothetical protein